MESFSALLALCVERSPVTGRFPLQRPVTRGLDIFFDLCQNKLSNKQPGRWWFETPSRPLWRHCDEALVYVCKSIDIYVCAYVWRYILLHSSLYLPWCVCTKSCVFRFEMMSSWRRFDLLIAGHLGGEIYPTQNASNAGLWCSFLSAETNYWTNYLAAENLRRRGAHVTSL